MKKILFVALAATLLAAGCQKTEVINQVSPNGAPSMVFSTEIAKLTKSATATGTENLQSQGFVLSAVSAYEDIHTSTAEFNTYYDDLKNTEFSYGDSKWSISTGESYFWPGTGRDLVFFAVSSSQETVKNPEIATDDFEISGTKNDETGLYTNVAVKNYVIKGYTVTAPTYNKTTEDTYVEQTGADDDLMVADVVIQNQDETPTGGEKGRVDLFFNHTLSKVEFVFRTNPATEKDFPVVVKSVVVEDVVKTANLTIGVDLTNRTSENVYDWNADDEAKTYAVVSIDKNNAEQYKIDYDLALTSTEKPYATWLVIPQDLTNKMVSITYTIGDNSEKEAKEFTSVWPLYTTALTAWNINQYVKYKVNLSPNLITFNPVVEKDWETAVDIDPSTGKTPETPTYNQVNATVNSESVVIYYQGDAIAVDTVLYVKNTEDVYVAASEGSYVVENVGTLTVDTTGKVTEITTAEN